MIKNSILLKCRPKVIYKLNNVLTSCDLESVLYIVFKDKCSNFKIGVALHFTIYNLQIIATVNVPVYHDIAEVSILT